MPPIRPLAGHASSPSRRGLTDAAAGPMRVCTWNIHAWGDAAGRSRVQDVIDVLRTVDADVVVLNEVLSPGGPLLRVAQALDKDVFYGPAAYGGNAVLAPRGSLAQSVPLVVPGGEARNAVVVDVGATGIGVVGVHLDDRREAVRCAQLRTLFDRITGLGPHVVAGDLNAIDPARIGLPLPALVRDLPAGGRRFVQHASGYVATWVAGDVITLASSCWAFTASAFLVLGKTKTSPWMMYGACGPKPAMQP